MEEDGHALALHLCQQGQHVTHKHPMAGQTVGKIPESGMRNHSVLAQLGLERYGHHHKLYAPCLL